MWAVVFQSSIQIRVLVLHTRNVKQKTKFGVNLDIKTANTERQKWDQYNRQHSAWRRETQRNNKQTVCRILVHISKRKCKICPTQTYKHIYTHCITSVSLFPSSHYEVKRAEYLHWLSYKRSSTNRKFCIFVTRKDNDYTESIQYIFFSIYIKFSGNREIALRQLLRFHCL